MMFVNASVSKFTINKGKALVINSIIAKSDSSLNDVCVQKLR